MADSMYDTLTLGLTGLTIELYRLIDFLNSTLHNYEQPLKRGYSHSDTSIRRPYYPDDTVSISVLLYIVTLPLLVITIRMFVNPVGSDTTLHRPGPMGLLGGAFLTALITAGIKLVIGRLAPNFYEGCQPSHPSQPYTIFWSKHIDYQAYYTCDYPERQREVSRSFPCIYTSLSSFSWMYLLIYCFYKSSSSLSLRTVTILICLAPPTFIANTRLRDHRSHPGDVIAGCMLGVFIALVSAIGRKESAMVESDQEIPRDQDNEWDMISEDEMQEEPIQPTVRVCTSALYSNIEGFVVELRDHSCDLVEDVKHVELPYNDLDSFTLDGWDKSDVVILCHSIENRRLSLTDVTDALYDNFIQKVSKLIGKDALIVIAHDFKWTDDQPPKVRKDQEETIRARQPTVYKFAEMSFWRENLANRNLLTCCVTVTGMSSLPSSTRRERRE
ncbi:uncharacterized protein LOC100890064 [Strongylocentrotus purpuratus]|uniref:Phosphatidic acid phosphatase type 2/haloperoxidase domain-containing protein n=1 Tax=Strongylocentrotus purpuratus TaxID=7668 RepID=A0A7M7GN11_STRPU|nr:uncharacterized protein LOC100890064 [Strongylocentrotus purpuratus]